MVRLKQFSISKKGLLMFSIATATINASAQEQSLAGTSNQTEVIEVSGIRGSLLRAMDVKRTSSGVVDAISAEDIGKFPDTNLAESLQRITGVAIDRSAGEGSKVTVRGFGADNNLITINGRQLPTTTGDRTFDFSNVASESVAGVQVYKTANAGVTSGGIGATINLETHKPLSSPGFKASIGGKLLDDQSGRVTSTTPEFSGLYSQTFNDDKFGISISGSYQERESGFHEFIESSGYRASEFTNTGWGGVPAGEDGGTNRPTSGIYSNSQQPRYAFEDRQRERINGQLVLQYQATDNLVATLDYLTISNTIEEQHTDASVWFNYAGDRSETIWSDGPNAVPIIYSEIYEEGDYKDSSLTVGEWGRKETTNQFGLNLEWQATEDLSFVFDHHSSEAELKATDPRHGTRNNIQLPSYTRGRTGVDFTQELPAVSTSNIEQFNPSTFRLSGSWFSNDYYTSQVEQTQVSGKYFLTDEFSIDFGASVNTVNNRFRSTQIQRADWGGVGTEGGGDFEDLHWEEISILDEFQSTAGDFSLLDSQSEYDLFDRIWFADFDTIVTAAELSDPTSEPTGSRWGDCQATSGAAAGPNGEGQFCASTNWDRQTNRFTEEDTAAYFIQAHYEGEIGNMPYDVSAGLRYEKTDVESTASAPGYSKVIWVEATSTAITGLTGIETLRQEASYSQTLPNINFNLEVTDDIIARVAVGKTISRASFADLLGGTNIGTSGTLSGYQGRSGNPALKPLTSTNFDLSLEWYYGEGSYTSFGYFKKDVKNWITTGVTNSNIYNLPNPFEGQKVNAALEALGASASNQDVRAWIFENYTNDPYVIPDDSENGGTIIGDPATDELITFKLNVPVNGDTKHTIDGLEFNVQHLFGESGFGAIVNYTFVDSDLQYDNLSLSDTEALVGLGDTANLVAFYDKNGIQARIAYNWRDDFLSERKVSGDQTAPIYTDAYAQIDFNVSYDVPQVEGLTVYIEGINITEEYTTRYGRDVSLIYNITETGARYGIGARYNF